MTVLVLKPFKGKSKGTIKYYTPGQKITVRPDRVSVLLREGFVRLTTESTVQVGRPLWQRPDGSCYACRGTESWLSIRGVTVCVRCHPPAHDGLVARSGTA